MPTGQYVRTEKTKELWSKQRKGLILNEDSWIWKGDDVGYGALHTWVIRRLGKPTTCEHCGKTGLTGMQIHWANKDHSYKRNTEDWLRLCASCHRIYDMKNNNLYEKIYGTSKKDN